MVELASTSHVPSGQGEKNWYVSALLILFTLIVALACIVLLSTTLTQSRVSTFTLDGAPLGIRKLDHIGRRWAKIPRILEDQTKRMEAAQSDHASASGRAVTTKATLELHRRNMEDVLVEFYVRIQPVEPDLAGRIHRKGYLDQVSFIKADRERLLAARPELINIVKQIEDTFERMSTANIDDRLAKADVDGSERKIQLIKGEIAATKSELDDVFEAIKRDLMPDDRARIENIFYELNLNNADEGFFNHFTYRMLTMPPDLATLLLVILMGILGSALQITHSYFMKNQVQTIGGYFQRISVGAMTALVIFIVAKAGVPVIADPTRLGGEAPINPYFVSFLAIVSGLLSENAIANVQAQGAKLFGGGEAEKKRWMRQDFTAELEAQQITVPQLAGYLGVDEEAAKDILTGEKELDPAQQRIVSICLRKSARDLFTDIPPPPK